MATKVNATELAQKILDTAEKNGFKVEAGANILTISRNFTPGDVDAFRDCDMSYGSVLGLLPRTSPGSDWGTDGGGLGGHVAIKSGAFRMQRSGGNKLVLKAIRKLKGVK